MLADEKGFTLVELLVVVLIIGALIGLAVPAYLRFTDEAQSTAAAADVREAGMVSVKPAGNGQAYCISAVSGGHWAHYSGPGGHVISDPSTVTQKPCA